MISDISDFYKSKLGESTILSFIGELDTESIDSILNKLEQTLDKFDDNIKVRRRVFNVMTELVQNLFHHADEIKPDSTGKTPSSVCVVDKNEGGYNIITANYIRNDKTDGFRKKLERINNFTPDELKNYYLEILNNGEKSDKDGAGLGMIEIARKAGGKLDFEFIKLDDEFSLFILNSKILK